MSRMNGKTRKYWYPILKKRDGPQCSWCGVSDKVKRLVIDHIDNSNDNNPSDGSNYQLLCWRHNILKGIKAKKERQPPQQHTRPIIDTMPATMQKNLEAEPKFVTWLKGYLKEYGELEYETCLVDGACIADCSQVTIGRYLEKHTSQYGPFFVYSTDDKKVHFIKLRTPLTKEDK
jgi:hypothetical protein